MEIRAWEGCRLTQVNSGGYCVLLILRSTVFFFFFFLHSSEIQIHFTIAFDFDVVVIVSSCLELAEYVLAGLEENPRDNGWNTNVGSPRLLMVQRMILCGNYRLSVTDSKK